MTHCACSFLRRKVSAFEKAPMFELLEEDLDLDSTSRTRPLLCPTPGGTPHPHSTALKAANVSASRADHPDLESRTHRSIFPCYIDLDQGIRLQIRILNLDPESSLVPQTFFPGR